MRLIDADKLNPDRMTNKGTVAISQSQIAKAPTVQAIPIDELKREIKNTFETGWCDCHVDTMMQIIDKISMELESE